MLQFNLTYCLDNQTREESLVIKIFQNIFRGNSPNEFAALKALNNKNMPVPTVHLFETTGNIIGSPFIIMEKIQGQHASCLMDNQENTLTVVKDMAKALFRVHEFDPDGNEELAPLKQQFETMENNRLKFMALVKESGKSLLCFGKPRQQRLAKALKKLELNTKENYRPTLIHREFEPNHIISSNNRLVIVDWGDALVGDPACDVAIAYHLLRLSIRLRELPFSDVQIANFFIKCYEQNLGHKLPNLQYNLDLEALELASLFGLSPFTANSFETLVRLNPKAGYMFGNLLGRVANSIKLRSNQRRMRRHHSNYNKSLECYHDYFLQYLETDRYS